VSAINPVMDYKISRFLFYDAMSAALKKPLKIESHSMVHYGPTSRGKTVQENINTSTVGNPKELEVLADSTKVGIIAHVAGMNDIPVNLEEATVAGARKIIAEVIYDIANGKEKNRGKKDGDQKDNIKTFRTAVHVTCENPFRDNLNNAGAAYRMGQIGALLPEGLGKIVSKTKKGVQKNYGHFYPLLIQNIIKNIDTVEDLYEEALLKIDTDCDLSQEMQGIVERSKDIYACTLVAGWLTEEVFKEISLPHKSKEEVTEIINHYFRECVIGEPVEPDWMRALKMINDWVFTEQNKFLGTEHYGNYGSIYGEITKTHIIVIGTEFTKKLTEEGFSPTAIKKAFLREGITVTNIGKDKTGNCNVKFDGKTKACIKIRIPVMEQKLGLGGNVKYSKDTLAVLDVIEIVSKHTGKGVKLSTLDELFDFNVIEHTYELVERGRINCSGFEYSCKDI
jgi:putative DNA primase/helicase